MVTYLQKCISIFISIEYTCTVRAHMHVNDTQGTMMNRRVCVRFPMATPPERMRKATPAAAATGPDEQMRQWPKEPMWPINGVSRS